MVIVRGARTIIVTGLANFVLISEGKWVVRSTNVLVMICAKLIDQSSSRLETVQFISKSFSIVM